MVRAILLFLALCSFSVNSFAQDPSYYKPLQSWQATALASMEALMVQRAQAGTAPTVSLGQWIAIGPFRGSTHDAFSEVFPPEVEFDPDKPYADGTLRWTGKPAFGDGTLIMFPQTDFCAMYLSRTLTTKKDTVLALSLGSDDGIKVWLDGVLVFQHDVYRGVEADQEVFHARLTPGTHRLLMKINNGQGAFGFYFALADPDMRTIWRLISRDFPSPELQQQRTWEFQDSIWAQPWTPGNYATLAQRYAAATLFDTPAERAAAIAAAEHSSTKDALQAARTRYIASRIQEITPVILTPAPGKHPRITGPKIFGVRPGRPFLYSIPATGSRPMTFSVRGLPDGLRLDAATGRITGVLAAPGRYGMEFLVNNSLGADARSFTVVVGDTIALTPPLGWNSWNCFASAVDDAKVRAAAEAMVSSGLVNHGWTYINIDDCWEIKPGSSDPVLKGVPREPNGMLNTNRKFPDMKSLSDFVHSKGLKLGIYSSPGPLTCAGFTGSYQYEPHDARQYAEWGIDYLKYDWCSYGTIEKERTVAALQKPYRVMRDALNEVTRDIVYSLCQYGMGNVWEWGGDVGGNCWRTTGDIEDTWESMSGIGFSQAGHEKYAKPGNWNDPDMLVVGRVGWGPRLHPTRLTPNEQYTHITLWSLLCSPLLIGCDMTQMDEFTLSLLTNDEVLAVNQDPLGRQAARIRVNGDLEVWAKDLEDGSKAVGLFNRGKWKSDITVSFADLGLSGKQAVRDLWRQSDTGIFEKDLNRAVPRHGAVLVKISPSKK